MLSKGPIPSYPGNRLVGVELEFDAGGARFNMPDLPKGWEWQYDGSLANGREFVLKQPLCYDKLVEKVKSLSQALSKANVYSRKTGGFHVHVQINDYTLEDCARLAELYRLFQPAINKLVAKSRIRNYFCRPFVDEVTPRKLSNMFELGISARCRGEARRSRQTMVINFAMFRCRNPRSRTAEFRQGSISKRTDCITGWVAFTLALTDAARNLDIFNAAKKLRKTVSGLKQLMRLVEKATGATRLADWVEWRASYLAAKPTPEMINLAVESLKGKDWHGIFYVAKKLNVHNELARKVLQAALDKKLLEERRGRFRASQASLPASSPHSHQATAPAPQGQLQVDSTPASAARVQPCPAAGAGAASCGASHGAQLHVQ